MSRVARPLRGAGTGVIARWRAGVVALVVATVTVVVVSPGAAADEALDCLDAEVEVLSSFVYVFVTNTCGEDALDVIVDSEGVDYYTCLDPLTYDSISIGHESNEPSIDEITHGHRSESCG